MKTFFLFYLFSLLTGNPLLALVLLIIIYGFIDRSYIGLMPDFLRPFKRKGRINDLKKELNLNPSNAIAAQELGVLLLETNKHQQALEYLEMALIKKNEYADIHFYLGVALTKNNRKVYAKKELEKAVEINKKINYGEPHYYLLGFALEENDEKKVEEAIEEIYHYGSPQILFLTGKLLAANEKKPEAMKMFKEAIANYEGSPKFFRKIYRRWAYLSKIQLLFLK